MDLGLSPDQIALQARARAFAETVARPRAAAIDRDEQYPWDIVKALAAAGFCGMTIPEALGGQGRSFLDAVLVIEEMAKACTVTARIVVETNMGAISTVMAYGSEAQKKLAAQTGAGRRQASHLHHRAGGRQRRARHDHARRQTRRRLCHQRQEALDHRRRRIQAASDLRARVRRARRGARHRRLPRGARRGRKRACSVTKREQHHGPARHAGRRADLRESRNPGRHGACCRRPVCGAALPT